MDGDGIKFLWGRMGNERKFCGDGWGWKRNCTGRAWMEITSVGRVGMGVISVPRAQISMVFYGRGPAQWINDWAPRSVRVRGTTRLATLYDRSGLAPSRRRQRIEWVEQLVIRHRRPEHWRTAGIYQRIDVVWSHETQRRCSSQPCTRRTAADLRPIVAVRRNKPVVPLVTSHWVRSTSAKTKGLDKTWV